ncbi:MAG: PTS sugar transporter subunit IIB [Coriobacteriales bacterium]|nr:PTS sugar transporter subunit IIB [Coriobacteriales bacterium]
MVSIVLASHGAFAEGIKQSGQMIFGPQEAVEAVVLTPEMGPEDLRAKLLKAISTFENQEQVLFLVDLWGGTPFNQVSLLLEEPGHENWVAVTGLNLPMVIAAYGERMGNESAADIAKAIFPEAVAGVKIKPEALQEIIAGPAAAAPAPTNIPTGAIPPGTVLGDGHIKIAFARIDTRLLHGQVATTVTKMVNPDRIIVCSDAVARDELRKTMIVQAAPPGVKVHVVPISKIIEVSKDPRFGDTKAMLLFETPQDLLRALEGGVDIKEVNLGSMAHSLGKVVVTNAVAMDQDDVDCIEKIASMGVTFDVRKVPADNPEPFDAVMKKAKAELAAQG